MYLIRRPNIPEMRIDLPASKSITHRIFILSALNDAECSVIDPLEADDTKITLEALKTMGAEFSREENQIHFGSGFGRTIGDKIYLGNSGTSARLLMPLCAYLEKKILLYGADRLHQRPFGELLSAVKQLGAKFNSKENSLPAEFYPSNLIGGEIKFDKLPSSQIVSGLMLAALRMENDLKIILTGDVPSLPYIKMTYELMKAFGIAVEFSKNEILVKPQNLNLPFKYKVEKDFSASSYWVIFSLLNEAEIFFPGLKLNSLQGDKFIFEIARLAGAEVSSSNSGIKICGGIRNGFDVDCGDTPDLVPAAAVLAMFAPENSTIRNIGHLQFKESDRIEAIQNNIKLLGGESSFEENCLKIFPNNKYEGTKLNSYNDHRIAMSFAIAGTRINNVIIDDPGCVSKSYPNFWRQFPFWTEM